MLLVSQRGRKYIIFRCPVCMKVKVWGKWIEPTEKINKEMADNREWILFAPVKCGGCE